MSTAYHPETDGSSERSNKTAIESLRQYINAHQTDWADYLVHVESAMNNSVNAITMKTPTELLYGTSLRLIPASIDPTSEVPAVTAFLDRIQDSIATAKTNMLLQKSGKPHTQTNINAQNPHPKLGTWRT